MGKKKGEAETMEKFSELQYVRPDMEKVLGDMRAVTEALKNAADFGEFKAAYMDYVNTDIQVSTARQLAHIRNTINMMDEFYEAEMGYFHAWMPKYEILVKEMGTVILNSPFKKDMEGRIRFHLDPEYGSGTAPFQRGRSGRYGKGSRVSQPVFQNCGRCVCGIPGGNVQHLRPFKAYAEHRPPGAEGSV